MQTFEETREKLIKKKMSIKYLNEWERLHKAYKGTRLKHYLGMFKEMED